LKAFYCLGWEKELGVTKSPIFIVDLWYWDAKDGVSVCANFLNW